MPLGGGACGSREAEVCELFGTHLLTKRACGPLQIRDIAAGTLRCAALITPQGGGLRGYGTHGWVSLPAQPGSCLRPGPACFADVCHMLLHTCREVPEPLFGVPSAFIYLPFNRTFLAFYTGVDAQASQPGCWVPLTGRCMLSCCWAGTLAGGGAQACP